MCAAIRISITVAVVTTESRQARHRAAGPNLRDTKPNRMTSPAPTAAASTGEKSPP